VDLIFQGKAAGYDDNFLICYGKKRPNDLTGWVPLVLTFGARLRHMQIEFPEPNLESVKAMLRQDFDVAVDSTFTDFGKHLPPLPPTETLGGESTNPDELEDLGPEDVALLEKQIAEEGESVASETVNWTPAPSEIRAAPEKVNFQLGGGQVSVDV
jgi:hypothetical protein